MERSEQVSRLIGAEIASEISDFDPFLALFRTIVWVMEILIILFDRAHRIILGTVIGRLEQGCGRIGVGITGIGCQLHLHMLFI